MTFTQWIGLIILTPLLSLALYYLVTGLALWLDRRHDP